MLAIGAVGQCRDRRRLRAQPNVGHLVHRRVPGGRGGGLHRRGHHRVRGAPRRRRRPGAVRRGRRGGRGRRAAPAPRASGPSAWRWRSSPCPPRWPRPPARPRRQVGRDRRRPHARPGRRQPGRRPPPRQRRSVAPEPAPAVTPEQQAAADKLLADTKAILPQWADSAVAEAAGFRTIGDGVTGNEHLINWALDQRQHGARPEPSRVARVPPDTERPGARGGHVHGAGGNGRRGSARHRRHAHAVAHPQQPVLRRPSGSSTARRNDSSSG